MSETRYSSVDPSFKEKQQSQHQEQREQLEEQYQLQEGQRQQQKQSHHKQNQEQSEQQYQQRQQLGYQKECVSAVECETTRTSCVMLTESKIKNSALNTKLWVVTGVLLFLVGTGSTFVCSFRGIGRAEEKIDSAAQEVKSLRTQVESLRQEIWDYIKSSKASSTTTSVPATTTIPSIVKRDDEGRGGDHEQNTKHDDYIQDRFTGHIARSGFTDIY